MHGPRNCCLIQPTYVAWLTNSTRSTGEVLETKEIRLDQLRLAPLDYVYAIEGGKGGQQAEIEQRILLEMMRQPDGFAGRFAASHQSTAKAGVEVRASWVTESLASRCGRRANCSRACARWMVTISTRLIARLISVSTSRELNERASRAEEPCARLLARFQHATRING